MIFKRMNGFGKIQVEKKKVICITEAKTKANYWRDEYVYKIIHIN